MAEQSKTPKLFSFKMEEREIVDSLLQALQQLRKRSSLSARQVHLCGVLQFALEQLPLVTPGIGLGLTLVQRWDENSDYQEISIDDECFEISTGETSYDPGVGSDHSSRTLVKIGAGWREGNPDLVQLEDWVAAFADRALDEEQEVSFEDFKGDSNPEWSDETDTAALWENLESDFA